MTKFENDLWYTGAGLLMGLCFSPVAYTIWWPVGLGGLVVWAFVRRENE